MSREYQVWKVTGADADLWPQFARLHQEEITDGFLSTFGVRYLTLLYSALSRAPHAGLFAAIEDGPERTVLGFICGATDTGRVYWHIALHNTLRFAPMVLPRLLAWKTLRKMAETLVYPAKTPVPGLPKPEILNFCVTRSVQGRGIGRALFQALMQEFGRRGETACKIVTGASQHQAQRFYTMVKAVRVGTLEVHSKQESLIFKYEIIPQRTDDLSAGIANNEVSK